MSSIRSKAGIVALCLLSAVVLMAGAAFAADKPVLKIGGVFTVTGPQSMLGDPEKKSMELFVEMVNKKGGIDGYMLESVIYDDEGDPAKAVSFTQRLINIDKVVAIVGPSLTPTTMPLIGIANAAGIPLISCAAGNKITLPPTSFVFKTAQSDILAVATIYRQMKAKKIKKVALLCVDTSFGQSGREQLKAQAAQFGLTVVADELYGDKDTDMSAQLTKMRQAAPQAIVCWGTNPGPAAIAKNAKDLKLGIPLYMSHGVASPKFIELAGAAAEGIMLPTGKLPVAALLPAKDPQKASLDAYAAAYTGKYSAPPSPFGGYAWDAMMILEKALKGSKGDKAKIRAGIEKVRKLRGVSGTFTFTPQDHNGLGADAFTMVVIKDGKFALMK